MKTIPRTVWALGFVSMFMDFSSEMIHSLLPVFLVSVLHASAVSVGLIEGTAEAVALVAKAFSGVLSDWIGRRKVLVFIGYAVGTLTKPLFAMAIGVQLVFSARVLDRIGKGIRGAPRDALIADATESHMRGAAYGLRQSLDTVGAVAGPLVAMLLMLATAGDFRKVFWIAAIPGVVALVVLVFFVKEPTMSSAKYTRRSISFRDSAALGVNFWMVVIVGVFFSLARFSEAFLLLRAQSVGMKVGMIPVVLVVMNLAYALTAYPMGKMSDKVGRTELMIAGLVALMVSSIVLATADGVWQVACGAVLWGLHMGLTQGILAAMVADAANERLRGTAFGIFSLATGLAVLASNLIAGLLWRYFGPHITFWGGSGFAAATLMGYLLLRERMNRQHSKQTF